MNRVIVDQIDPEVLMPGGTDTCIFDLVKYSRPGVISIVGVTHPNSGLPLGEWTRVAMGTVKIDFLPVARLDRSLTKRAVLRLPQSAKLALGVLRYRQKIRMARLQAHRVEIGFICSLIGRNGFIQFIHNDARGLTGPNSESSWRHLPRLYRRLERRALGQAKQVVLFSKSDAPRVRALCPSVKVSTTWYDPELFALGRIDRPSGLHLVFIGRLESQKDPALAIETFRFVSEGDAAATLTMVGDGSMRPDLEALVKRYGLDRAVEFVGPLLRPDVANLLSNSTVLLMTSHYEGSPRVLFESLASGVPVVATAESDPEKLLDGVSNGYRVPTRLASDLAASVVLCEGVSPRGCADSVASYAAPVLVRSLLDER